MTNGVKVKSAAVYAGVSERTFREWLKKGLRHSKLHSGTILIQLSAIDDFLNSFTVEESELDQIVEEVLSDFN